MPSPFAVLAGERSINIFFEDFVDRKGDIPTSLTPSEYKELDRRIKRLSSDKLLNYHTTREWDIYRENFGDIKFVRDTSEGFLVLTEDSLFTCLPNHDLSSTENELLSKIPLKAKKIRQIKQIDCGNKFYGALTEKGSLYLWGKNNSGQLGTGDTVDKSEPFRVLKNVKSFSCGPSHVVALTKKGSVFAWGSNDKHQISNEENESILRPFEINADA